MNVELRGKIWRVSLGVAACAGLPLSASRALESKPPRPPVVSATPRPDAVDQPARRERPEAALRSPTDPSVVPTGGGDIKSATSVVTYSEAGLKPGEVPMPGTKFDLDLGEEAVEGTTYRWVQIEGPKVAIAAPDRSSVEIEIPINAERLVFLRIEGSAGRIRVIRFVLPVGSTAGVEPVPSGTVHADAGDDQVGLIGHRVTLNGSKSAPAVGSVFRWIQVSGPPIMAAQQDRAFFSFVPTGPGLYQFALVVGAGRSISEPDGVSVLVGSAPAGAGLTSVGVIPPASSSPGPPAAAAAPTPPPLPSPEAIVVSALPRIAGGIQLAGEVADVFEAVAERASLYSSFGDAQSELSRRLDVVIPTELPLRLAWSDSLLQPLTQHTVAQMAAVGLDVSQSTGMAQPLSPNQRERMKEHLMLLTRAFRGAAESSKK